MKLTDILKDLNYRLSQFTTAEIEKLEQSITLKLTKSGEVPCVICLVRQKAIKLTPEEAIRQLYLRVLVDRLHYPVSRIRKLFVEKYFKGSSGQIELYPNDIAQFLIWDAPKDIQQKIRSKVEASHKSESNLNNY